LIDFYKAALGKHEERGKTFKFSFQSTSHYEDISQFYAEVEQQGYKLSRKGINSSVLEQFVEEGKCYLFEISCKDFIKQNPDSKDSLQAIYWKNMFTPHSNIKLNGEAEIFFRPASLKEKHQVQTNQYTITNEKAIKSGRYTEDRFLFHCPITLHFGTKAEGKFNQRLNQHLKPYIENGLFRSARNDEGRQMHIIGVDRGEKHLNFYSVINMQGKIVEQGTLNIVNGTNYETLLSARATERNSARQNRDTIGSIKDLKDGYISQVVHQLANLVLKYNAVIVLEDLNSGFKRGRQKIEKSVYQKLELALAKKLSYFVCKGTPAGQSGSATNAYQLCPLVSNFGDIKGKQWGILFYTRANYTSTTDPISGWRKNLYLKKGKRDEMKKQILNFTKIAYDNEKSAFYFTYNPRNFSEGKGLAKERTLRSNVERWRGKREDNGQRNQEMV
jgi:CRISPR-associated protein Cpf1